MPTLPARLPTATTCTFVLGGQLRRVLDAAIGDDDDAALLPAAVGLGGQPAGEGHRVGELGRPIGRPDAVEGVAERPLVAGQAADDPRLRAGGDDRHLVADPQAVDDAAGPPPWPSPAGSARRRWRSCWPSCRRPGSRAGRSALPTRRTARPGPRPAEQAEASWTSSESRCRSRCQSDRGFFSSKICRQKMTVETGTRRSRIFRM